jgi:glycine oxidase
MLPDFQPNSEPKSSQTEPAQQFAASQVVVAGAGIIGLSIALELDRRGVRVTVLERGKALQQASTAAAGMLAAEDPHNPAALLPLSRYSLSLYPEYLRRIESLSGLIVPFQTSGTIQYLRDGSSVRLTEHSVDPRQLADALLAAVRSTSITLLEETALESSEDLPDGMHILTSRGDCLHAGGLVIATGAWSGALALKQPLAVSPRKGQMLRVKIPAHLQLNEAHRNERIYIVPRIYGPQAGTALIGATIEDAGFDITTNAADLAGLRALAAELVPELASESDAPMVEAWAGLRPGTEDELPLLGGSGHTLYAVGHFRNGILLAPATAAIIADLYEGKSSPIDLSAFAPDRWSTIPALEINV